MMLKMGFYTPKMEIIFLCWLILMNNLANQKR
jgi:hypothetical protein